MLLKLFGRRDAEDARLRREGGGRPRPGRADLAADPGLLRRDDAVPQLATALVYGIGGCLAIRGDLSVGTLVALGVLLAPAARTPAGALQRAHRRDDRAGQLRPGLRGARPAVAHRGEARRRGRCPPRRPALEFDHVDFTYPRADEVSLASLETVARVESRDSGQVLHEVTFTAEPGQMVALVGPSGAGKTTVTHLVARLYDATAGAVRVGGHDVRDVTLESLEDVVGYVTQDAHMFHDTIRANLLYARPAADEAEIWGALEAAQIAALVRALPDGLDTVVGDRGYRLSRRRAPAPGHRPAAAQGARPSWSSTRPPPTSTASRRPPSSAPSTRRWRDRTSLVIAHRLSTVRNADLILVLEDGRVVQSGTHAELLAAGRALRDLHATQFREDRPRLGSGDGPRPHRSRLHRHRRSPRARPRHRGGPGRRGRTRGGLRSLAGLPRGRRGRPRRPGRPLGRGRRGGGQLRPRHPGTAARRGRRDLGTPRRRADHGRRPAEGAGDADERRPVDHGLRVGLPRCGTPGARDRAALPAGGALGLVLSSSVRAPLADMAISNGLRPGLAMVAKTLSDELGPRGVRVNGLLPGRIATDGSPSSTPSPAMPTPRGLRPRRRSRWAATASRRSSGPWRPSCCRPPRHS